MQKGSYAISALHGQLATECHLGSTGTSGLHRRNTDLGAKDVEQSEAKAVRVLGVILICGGLVLSSPVVLFVGADPPRQHFMFTSEDRTRAALLSHSELRDGAVTEVTVKGDGCCTRYVAYRYFGDGDDHVGAKSLDWVDDHHLTIRYVRDPSGVQDCRSHVGDVEVLCQLQPEPFGSAKPQGAD